MRTYTTQSARAALAAKDVKIAALRAEIRELQRKARMQSKDEVPSSEVEQKRWRAKEREAIKQACEEIEQAFPNYRTNHDEFEKAVAYRDNRVDQLCPPLRQRFAPEQQIAPTPAPEPKIMPASKPTSTIEDKPGNDLLWGGQAVADYLGISRDKVYYLIKTKRLPISKLGKKTVVASKKKLQRAIDKIG